MDFQLSDEHRLLRDNIVRFAKQELNDDVRARDRNQEFPHELWKKCGEMGLQGLPVPETYGGSGLDPLSVAIALEAFGHGCRDGGLVFSVGAHLLACVVPVWRHGSEEQKRRYLPDLCTGSLIAVNGMTEPETGSDAFAMATVAVENNGAVSLVDPSRMDVIVQFPGGNNAPQRLTYAGAGPPNLGEWASTSISGSFDPGIFDPGEDMQIDAKLSLSASDPTGTVTVATPNGVIATASFPAVSPCA